MSNALPNQNQLLRVIVAGGGKVGFESAILSRRDWTNTTIFDESGSLSRAGFGNTGASMAILAVTLPGLIRKFAVMMPSLLRPIILRWSIPRTLLPAAIRYPVNGTAQNAKQNAAALQPAIASSPDHHLSSAEGTKAQNHIKPIEIVVPDEVGCTFGKDAVVRQTPENRTSCMQKIPEYSGAADGTVLIRKVGDRSQKARPAPEMMTEDRPVHAGHVAITAQIQTPRLTNKPGGKVLAGAKSGNHLGFCDASFLPRPRSLVPPRKRYKVALPCAAQQRKYV